jgi:hypothetical protein
MVEAVIVMLTCFLMGAGVGGYLAIKYVFYGFVHQRDGQWGSILKRLVDARKSNFGVRCLDNDYKTETK